MAGGEQDLKFYAAAVERLVRYGQAVWRDGRKLTDGATAGDHKSSAAKQWAALGRPDLAKAAQTSLPPFPFEVSHLWDWFNDLSWGLKSNGMGPATASWSDVLGWCEAVDVDPEPWERRALVRLAAERATVLSEKIEQAAKQNGNQGQAGPNRHNT